MNPSNIELFKELNPGALQKKFLNSLLKIQNVHRGSIWIKKNDSYLCIEAAGAESDRIKGVCLDVQHPSIVGWVIENKKQYRIALRNCGLINPEDINEYIAYGGYEAFGKVLLEMQPMDVVNIIKDSGWINVYSHFVPVGKPPPH